MKKKTSRYNGRNIYGQSCISKFVILRKETAMKQYFDALEDIEAHKGERVEYTFVLAADVPPREAEMLYQQMDKIAALRAGEQGKKFVSNAFLWRCPNNPESFPANTDATELPMPLD